MMKMGGPVSTDICHVAGSRSVPQMQTAALLWSIDHSSDADKSLQSSSDLCISHCVFITSFIPDV